MTTANFSWEILFGMGVVLLGLGLAWGLWRYTTRDRRNDAISEAATRAQYDHPDTYQDQIKPQLDNKLH